MHHMEQRLLFYPMLIDIYICIHLNLLEKKCGHSRKDISCELPGIFTLVYVHQDFTDEVPLYFSVSGYI